VTLNIGAPLDILPGPIGSDLLITADHASNHVPDDIDLGLSAPLMGEHIALDIGAGAVARQMAARLGAHAIFGHVSRLVIDLNREEEADGLIPASSDGHVIHGNVGISLEERERRLATLHRPYHDAIAGIIDRGQIKFIVSVHSFTPALASQSEARPWPVGILYNTDSRAADIAILLLKGAGINVGDNQPYSGRVLNYTMNRHAEARGLPYLGFEVRQDELATPSGIGHWADLLSEVVAEARTRL
jgi:predicted N-formylglutamate amidohydrolase